MATTNRIINTNSATIKDIESMTESDIAGMALEVLDIKGHTVYMVDFGGYFGYSCLVCLNGHHIYYANDYELHHSGRSRDELRELYLGKMRSILFTQDEIAAPLADYDEYRRKEHYLRNYYGMQEDRVSMFCILHTKQEEQEYEEKIAGMVFNPVGFAYYNNVDFVVGHVELFRKLEAAKDAMGTNFEYWKDAFKREMANHEYHINWQADYDTLSAFGCIQYHGDEGNELEQYFDELNFSDVQRKAYLEARREYLRECEF